MVVYTLFHPARAGLLRLWALSWERRGWETRLLTQRDIEKHGSVKRAMKGRPGIFVTPDVINFDWAPPKRKPRRFRVAKFSTRHWEVMSLVKFESEFQVLGCGRLL